MQLGKYNSDKYKSENTVQEKTQNINRKTQLWEYESENTTRETKRNIQIAKYKSENIHIGTYKSENISRENTIRMIKVGKYKYKLELGNYY